MRQTQNVTVKKVDTINGVLIESEKVKKGGFELSFEIIDSEFYVIIRFLKFINVRLNVSSIFKSLFKDETAEKQVQKVIEKE
jgi:hypothetical protein